MAKMVTLKEKFQGTTRRSMAFESSGTPNCIRLNPRAKFKNLWKLICALYLGVSFDIKGIDFANLCHLSILRAFKSHLLSELFKPT